MGNTAATSTCSPLSDSEAVKRVQQHNDNVNVVQQKVRQNQDVVCCSTGNAIKDLISMGFQYRMDATGSSNSMRLIHIDSNQTITSQNRQEYIPDGPVFDEVSRLCQIIAQEKLMREEPLKWVTLCDDAELEEPVRAMVDDEGRDDFEMRKEDATTAENLRPILIIITGKGISRAGILSAKELLTSGMDEGSAQFHIKEARKRGMKLYILDPNARGPEKGMDTVERSMTALYAKESAASCGPIHVLAHSAGGGQLVRYLLLGQARHTLLPRIRSICFTDSTHNIQWARDDPGLFELLQSPSCLYIKNNSVRASDTLLGDGSNNTSKAGEEAITDTWWRHRFGNVQTVWAGTQEHSLVCWEARRVIWNHFDKYA